MTKTRECKACAYYSIRAVDVGMFRVLMRDVGWCSRFGEKGMPTSHARQSAGAGLPVGPCGLTGGGFEPKTDDAEEP